MFRLKTTKTKMYKLVREYEPMPPMRRVTFIKADRRPDYWMRWMHPAAELRCDAYLAVVGGRAKLVITKTEPGGPEVSRMVHTLDINEMMGRGMVENFVPAAERRRAERMSDHELL